MKKAASKKQTKQGKTKKSLTDFFGQSKKKNLQKDDTVTEPEKGGVKKTPSKSKAKEEAKSKEGTKSSKSLPKNLFPSKKRPYSEIQTEVIDEQENVDINTNKKAKKPVDEGSLSKIETLKNPFKKDTDDCLETYESFIGELGDWSEPLKLSLNGSEFKLLYKYVKREYRDFTCYPPRHQIFNAYKQSSLQDIKVVILGQDPYINEHEAMGMCFSITQNAKVPPSLKAIYAALRNDQEIQFQDPDPLHGDLTQWAKQGVFMLNAVLTVRQGKSNSHQKKGWETFTKETLRVISKNCENVVYLLWGKKAHEAAKLINGEKNLIIQEVHPSPLAGQGFKTTKCFSDCNKYLKKSGKLPIDWNI